jgi:hypothetical protein
VKTSQLFIKDKPAAMHNIVDTQINLQLTSTNNKLVTGKLCDRGHACTSVTEVMRCNRQ